MAPVHLITWLIASALVNSLRLPIQSVEFTPFYQNAPTPRSPFALLLAIFIQSLRDSLFPPANGQRPPRPLWLPQSVASPPSSRRNRPEHLAV
jgi:hypothetical protein